MCNCKILCRSWSDETQHGKYPMPRHSPACEDYKTERYIRVIFEDRSFTATPEDAHEFMDTVKYDKDAEEYKYEEVYLTKDQFNNLPEFDGF